MKDDNEHPTNDNGDRIYSEEEMNEEIERNQDVCFNNDGTLYSSSAGH